LCFVDSWQDVTGALVGGLALSLIQRRSTSSGHNWKRLVSRGDRLTLAGFRENNEVMEIAMTELVKTVSALQYRLAAEWSEQFNPRQVFPLQTRFCAGSRISIPPSWP
jgi:hypothetical protein